MSLFRQTLQFNERRRPGITALYWEIRKYEPGYPWRLVMSYAKDEWHKRYPLGVPR